MNERPRAIRLMTFLLIAGLMAACGDADTEGASAVGADSGDDPAECAPVNEDLESQAVETVAIELQDYAFAPARVAVDAGTVTFVAENTGSENHELAFLPGGGEVPLNDEGESDEDALAAAGAFELEAFGPGDSCNATYALDSGTYTMFCIVCSADGETHYEKGMKGELVVR